MTRFDLPSPGRQVFVQKYLDDMRQTSLHDALHAAVRRVSPTDLRTEVTRHAPADGLQLLQGTGVRDEEVFATPSVLRAAPGVLGYYRLLLGVSNKAFYTPASGLSVFRGMEDRGVVSAKADPLVEDLCTDLNQAMTALLHAIPQGTLARDVEQLPLMLLGAQADGSWRVQIGQRATTEVFEAMKLVVKQQGSAYTETDVSITVRNRADRDVTLALAPDPDVVIRERVNGEDVYKCAIEIKGGSDYANLHNRVGEAEKSHQKASADGAQVCWTIISLENADMARLRQESPTTREWLDIRHLLRAEGPSWDRLTMLTISAMGI